jgi:outer membrane protein OmpA-like peptidoglycan-associated protein
MSGLFSQGNRDENSHWISFSDLFAGFMVVFIIISILSINKTNLLERSLDGNSDKPVEAHYAEMVDNFRKIINDNKIEGVGIADSATIRFYADEGSKDLLFVDGESIPTDYFNKILNEFIPVYVKELHKVYTQKGQSASIKEIRIEGHTDSRSSYQFNLKLSGERANAIHEKLFLHDIWNKYDKGFKEFVRSKSITCGYSFSKRLDRMGNYISDSGKPEDFNKSRRVELRVFLSLKGTTK